MGKDGSNTQVVQSELKLVEVSQDANISRMSAEMVAAQKATTEKASQMVTTTRLLHRRLQRRLWLWQYWKLLSQIKNMFWSMV